MAEADGRSLLLVGGGGGLLGRAIVDQFGPEWKIRSVHRHRATTELRDGVEWLPGDVSTIDRWEEVVQGIDIVINVAWYRHGSRRRFEPLTSGLLRLLAAAVRERVPRFLQVSVPPAPERLECSVPYFTFKRVFDRALTESGLSYTIVRPGMLFGPEDRFLSVMLRRMHRYSFFPMFADGEYHVSPLSVRDLAHVLRHEADRDTRRTVTGGGPARWRFRDLTDRMFEVLGKRPSYWPLSADSSVRLARTLERWVGSSPIYAYEVEWFLSDMLGLPPIEELDRPLTPVEPFLTEEVARLRRKKGYAAGSTGRSR